MNYFITFIKQCHVMKKHILLIADNKNELTIFMDALRKVPHDDGFKCTYAASASQAIEMLKYLVPDYIFADFNTPGADSFNLLNYIKVQERFKKTKLCLFSNHTNVATQTTLNPFYIQKTNDVGLLASSLSGYLDYRSEPEHTF